MMTESPPRSVPQQTPKSRRYDLARREVTTAVYRIVTQDAEQVGEDPQGRFEGREIYPGAGMVRTEPRPQYQLEAAQALISAAKVEERKALEVARGQGVSWEQLAVWLGFTGDLHDADGYEIRPAAAAWQYAVTGTGPGGRVDWSTVRVDAFVFRCFTCTKSIRDTGPENGVAGQGGHAGDCTRFARELEADRASWDEQ